MSVRMATPFKHPRTGVYYIRRAVPKDIRETFGKSEYLKSLGTKNDREAKLLFPAALQESDAEFARARGRLAAVDVLNDVQIREVGEAWAAHILTEDEEARLDGVSDRDHARTQETLEDVLSHLKADLARGRVSDGTAWEFDDFLKSYGFNVPTNTMNYRRVHMGMLRAWIRAMEGQLLRQQGEPIETPEAPEIGPRRLVPGDSSDVAKLSTAGRANASRAIRRGQSGHWH